MKPYFGCILWALLLSSSLSFARDRLRNGGGVWVCASGNQIHDLQFVDLFELTEERLWEMKFYPSDDYESLLEFVARDVDAEFPHWAQAWRAHLSEVLEKVKFVSIKLEHIDDAIPRGRPLPEACPLGVEWEYGQLANFNEFDEVSIRTTYWNHPTFSSMEKAALMWHEAIYLWLRTTHGDQNSIRARYIVGLIFAKLPVEEKRILLKKILLDSPLPNPSPEPQQKWFCAVYNGINHVWHGGYGAAKLSARAQALDTCRSAPASFHCREEDMVCEGLSANVTTACSIQNVITNKDFYAEGRSLWEAKYKSHKACEMNDPSKVFHCQLSSWTCEGVESQKHFPAEF